MKSKRIAILLALFLGVIGMQKLYLNADSFEFRNILVLALATFGVASFMFGLWDSYNLFVMDKRRFNNKYNRINPYIGMN